MGLDSQLVEKQAWIDFEGDASKATHMHKFKLYETRSVYMATLCLD